ncbi:MAG TPA: RNA polymerase sigma factor [Candidatus Gracilibacteria bacterium]|nr:RNA polymerase sigma factor [Candidatus Gracilibacteria bacterium]
MATEKQLIEAAQQDKTAFVALYDANFEKIFKYVVSRVYNQHDAQDITSETFMTALEKMDDYEYTGKPFSAWLYRIAINKMNDYFRSNQKAQKTAIKQIHNNETKAEAADTSMKEHEEQIEFTESLSSLHLALEKLKDDEKHIITLKYFENLSYKEIAETLNITTSNVGVKLNRAMARLQQMCNY